MRDPKKSQVRGTLGAMVEAGEFPADHPATAVQGDALGLPFPDGTFDRVIPSEVLEHIPDDEAAISELSGVLRPGGTMAVTVPHAGPEAINWVLSDEYHDTPGGHVWIYRRSTLERRLGTVGLKPIGFHHAHGLHWPYWWLRCSVGPSTNTSGRRGLPQGAGAGHCQGTVRDPTADRVSSPLIGRSSGALPDQTRTAPPISLPRQAQCPARRTG